MDQLVRRTGTLFSSSVSWSNIISPVSATRTAARISPVSATVASCVQRQGSFYLYTKSEAR